ncbi:hypothetical protein INH39_27615 [Massilia violaceinigra]|uniref:Uncharacterized protein n=1 Tax=Massilia violaceinigra TaxID=2045208 RepID=A0ABY4A332_9BURK|nr:hypothetical protein [Massilia violaceinigra]UOD29146.1 hypothetical protein INH39_27615 [Massilia violaceinigra]
MDLHATLTIDDFRNKCDKARKDAETYHMHPSSAYWELADLVLESLAQTGSAALFTEAEAEVRRIVLRALRHYKRTGRRELCAVPDGRFWDGGPEARAAITTLAAAGLVPQSMTSIAVPVPVFRGLELIRGVGALEQRLPAEDSLLRVELVSLTRVVANPRAYPDQWTMSLQITEDERRNVDGGAYEREVVRCCVATFGMRRNVYMDFWPRFSLGDVRRFSVIQKGNPFGNRKLIVKLDMGDKGKITCGDMELLQIEDISCTG